jgi:hypothetical protein
MLSSYPTLPPSYSTNYRPTLEELNIAPNDDHSEEEEDYGFNAYPDSEASQID